MPVVCCLPVIFSCIVYPALRLRREPFRFLSFLGIMILNSLSATSLGIMVSAATSSVREANSIAPVVMVISLLFGGFYVNSQNMHAVLRWVSQLSFLRHTFAALTVNEFKGLQIPCPKGATGCLPNGDAVLSKLSLDGVTVGRAVLIEVVLLAVVPYCSSLWGVPLGAVWEGIFAS